MNAAFVVIWAFVVRPEYQAQFEQAYASDGDWALFFRQDSAYNHTELRQDLAQPLRYITLDYWQSQTAYEAFKVHWQSEYYAFDERFADWTESETLIGQFLLK